jgi:hypothetical protein
MHLEKPNTSMTIKFPESVQTIAEFVTRDEEKWK